MSTHDAYILEDLAFDEAPDMVTAMMLPDLRHYVADDTDEEGEPGLRALFEYPEALSKSLRRQWRTPRGARMRWRPRAHV